MVAMVLGFYKIEASGNMLSYVLCLSFLSPCVFSLFSSLFFSSLFLVSFSSLCSSHLSPHPPLPTSLSLSLCLSLLYSLPVAHVNVKFEQFQTWLFPGI